MTEEPTTVTATGIARIAGVGRAAVSNWRRRHQDFPRPIAGTAASPAFDLDEVELWLDQQGKLRTVGPLDRLQQRLEALGTAGQSAEALVLVGLTLLTAPAEVPTPRQLADAVRLLTSPRHADVLLTDLPVAWSPTHREILEVSCSLSDQEDRVGILEHLHAQYVTARGAAGLTYTPVPVVSLMLDLVGPAASVLDVACGTGTFLRAAFDRVNAAGGTPQLLGLDARPEHVRIALLRLLVLRQQARAASGTGDELCLRVGDPLLEGAFPVDHVDAVVGSPPHSPRDWGHDRLAFDPRWAYGGLPPRTEPELAWVQHVLAQLKPGGRAALLLSPAVAARPAGRRIRSELVRRGALQAVVGLPPTATVGSGNGVHVWLLRRPDEDSPPPTGVLFVNGDDVPLDANVRPKDRLEALRRHIAPLWDRYRKGHGPLPTDADLARDVPLAELLDEDVDFTPRHRVPNPDSIPCPPDDLLKMQAVVKAQLNSLRDTLPEFAPAQAPTASGLPTATLGELSRTGALSLHRHAARAAHRDAPDPDRHEPALTSQDVIAGRRASGSVPVSPDDDPAARVRAHDILIPAIAQTLVARVATDEQIGARLGPGVHAVRVDLDYLDPWFAAGALTRSENATKAARTSTGTSGALRIDVKRLRLPVLAIEEQRRRSETLRRLTEWDAALSRLAEAGHEAVRALTSALVDGALDPLDK
ncbi:N-6 DNA methylase [Streptomyces sp. YIM S03343]